LKHKLDRDSIELMTWLKLKIDGLYLRPSFLALSFRINIFEETYFESLPYFTPNRSKIQNRNLSVRFKCPTWDNCWNVKIKKRTLHNHAKLNKKQPEKHQKHMLFSTVSATVYLGKKGGNINKGGYCFAS